MKDVLPGQVKMIFLMIAGKILVAHFLHHIDVRIACLLICLPALCLVKKCVSF